MMENTREARIEWGRTNAMSEDVREELDELDVEDAFETDAELDNLEDDEEAPEKED
jgi:hypothetical protein